MKVIYKIPDSDNHKQNKLLGLFYDRYALRIKLACGNAMRIIDKENGIVIIQHASETSLEIIYENFSPTTELIIRYCIAGMRVDNNPVDLSQIFKQLS